MYETTPDWYQNGKLNEVKFAKEYIETKQLVYADGAFFSPEGRLADENEIRKEIYKSIRHYITKNISRKVDNLMQVIRLEAMDTHFDTDQRLLHLKNGTLVLDFGMLDGMSPCRNRLPVTYDPTLPPPRRWLSFLHELLEEEDIQTLQEYMGYCLIPTTKAQKMLLIIGRGGEGKSRIGIVMKAMLGNSMNMGSLAKLETSPFARADLQHILCMVDDDLRMEALPGTNHIKSIITAETDMDLERKGIQSYQGRIYARFLAFGNGSLQALHDRSYGFFRRQIILTTKMRPSDRRDDPDLSEKLKQEIDQIFLWCLEGLNRLQKNNYRFTISQRAQENLALANSDGNNILDFMQSQGYFLYSEGASITSRKFYHLYQEWCDDNMIKPYSAQTFWTFLRQEAMYFGIMPSKHIHIGEGKDARGFHGIMPIR